MRDASEDGLQLRMRWEAKARHAGARQESHSTLCLMSSSELSSKRCGSKRGWGGWKHVHSSTFTPHKSPTPWPIEVRLEYAAAGTAGRQPAARGRRTRPRRCLPETSVCGSKGGVRVVTLIHNKRVPDAGRHASGAIRPKDPMLHSRGPRCPPTIHGPFGMPWNRRRRCIVRKPVGSLR
jgi:hypothetical protein